MFWYEIPSTVIVSCSPADTEQVIAIAKKHGASGAYAIGRTANSIVKFSDSEGLAFIDATVAELKEAWSRSLESAIREEVVA